MHPVHRALPATLKRAGDKAGPSHRSSHHGHNFHPLQWDKPQIATRCVGVSIKVSVPTAQVPVHMTMFMHVCHATAQIMGSTAVPTRRKTKLKGKPALHFGRQTATNIPFISSIQSLWSFHTAYRSTAK